jgi:hypothetical protein
MAYSSHKQRRERFVTNPNGKECRAPDDVDRCKGRKEQSGIRRAVWIVRRVSGRRARNFARSGFCRRHEMRLPASPNTSDSNECSHLEAQLTAPFWCDLHRILRERPGSMRYAPPNCILGLGRADRSSFPVFLPSFPFPFPASVFRTITKQLILGHLARFPQVDARSLSMAS